MNNVLLNLRTEYSVGASAARTEALLDRAHEFRLTSVGRVDRGTLLGIDHFARAAQARGLRPVAGVELELATLTGAPATLEELTTPATWPIVLFAETDAGYRNLVRLVTVAHSRAGHGDRGRPATAVPSHPHGLRGAGRPFVTLDDLIQHRSGLIAQSPGLGGEISSRIQRGQADLAEQLALRLAEVFGRSAFYLGLACHGHADEARLAADLRELSDRTGILTVAAPEVDHLDPDDARLRDLRRRLDAAGQPVDRPGPDSHFRAPAEWRRIYRDHPDAWERAAELAARCAAPPARLGPSNLRYPLPPGRSEAAYLASLCGARLPRQAAYGQRFEAEMDQILKLDLAGYFLVLWDLHRYVQAHHLGGGAGTAPLTSSLLAWLLGITGVDPVAGGLQFEHFLHEAQAGPPPASISCDPERAAEISAYLEHRFGPEGVFFAPRIRTFTARQAVRELGTALTIDNDTIELFARHIPDADADLPAVLARHDSLAHRYRQESHVRTWLNLARRLQGLPRAVEADPGRLVLVDGSSVPPAPVRRDRLGRRFLEVSTATAPALLTIQLVTAPRDRLVEIVVDAGVTDPVTRMSLQQVARHEPALVDRFRRRAMGEEPVRIVDRRLESALGRTQGLLIEEEQVVQIAESLAGFNPGEAEEFRRIVCAGPAVGEVGGPSSPADVDRGADARATALHRWRFLFVEGAQNRGLDPRHALGIFMSLVDSGPRLARRADSLAQAAAEPWNSGAARLPEHRAGSGVASSDHHRSGTGRPAAAALAASAGPLPRSHRRLQPPPAQLDMPWASEPEPADRPVPRRTGTYGEA